LQALSRRGLTIEVLDLAVVPRDSRRRVTFQAERTEKGVVLGFAERRGHRIVDIDACPLLLPAINDLLPLLRDLAAAMLQKGERARLAVARTEGPDGGALDLVVERDREPDLAAREAIHMHGAIGMTRELGIGYHLLRVDVLSRWLGSAEHFREKFLMSEEDAA